jgi:glycosyltransferase involved in cell wall biosynthesis
MRPYLEQASLFVAPLRFGAGLQNKLLEAMAMEVPVVTSPLAAAGLTTAGGDGPPFEIAGDVRQFSDTIIDRLRRQSGDGLPDRTGRQFVAEHFDWARNARRLEAILEDLAKPQTAGGLASVPQPVRP